MTPNSYRSQWFPGLPPVLAASVACLTPGLAWAEPGSAAEKTAPALLAYRFDSRLLLGSSLANGLERFNTPNQMDPGDYLVDVFVNGAFLSRQTVSFRREGEHPTSACLDQAFLLKAGVLAESLPPDEDAAAACWPLALRIPGAGSVFDLPRLRLELSVPQAAMKRRARGYVAEEDLDAGAAIGFVNYDANSYRSSSGDVSNTYHYVSADAGVNLGLWRLRQQSNYSGGMAGGGGWNHIRSYAQRALPAWQSELTLGESSTGGSLLSGLSFRGVQLSSDDRMLPESLRGYAPVVRGVADSNARVVVRQGKQEIYQTVVAPGPFVIDDLFPTSYQGDLDVEITEADGQVKRFTVPFAAVPGSMRPGQTRYSLTLGQLRNALDDKPVFADFTYQRGVNNALTANMGARAASHYTALLGGMVWGSSYGALGADATYSRSRDGDGSLNHGWRAALSYSHTIQPTATSITLAGYRYSTRGYRDLVDALGARQAFQRGETWNSSTFQQRNQFTVSVNQRLGGYGSLGLSAAISDYYNGKERDTQLQLSYQNQFRSISYGVSVSRQRMGQWQTGGSAFQPLDSGRVRNTVMFNLSMPLGKVRRAPMLAASMSRSEGERNLQLSLSGTADEAQTVSYGVNASHNSQSSSGAFGANVQKRFPLATVGGSYSRGRNFTQTGASARGALAVHRGGVTFGPYLSETFGLVEAPGASGAAVRNGMGATVDRAGYALIPSLTPYRYNDVALDSKGLADGVELQGDQLRTAPYAGAAVRLKFATRRGQALLIKGRLADGSVLPMGAMVYAEDGANIGMVGQGGQAYARVAARKATLRVKWGETADSQCALPYALQDDAASRPIIRLEAECAPLAKQ
ncbi:outer membrane usher protein [Chromobacterium alkanivorans]|uniref:fimbria/pilus outer membrane usher protein n=1 Tax=Chromobacterium alkanivorans TaxID=1071719 RepID=UPI00216864EE|nr:fimbria/pilus outer membrane usher protein [Chromobacterium alkanivorans]MCS3806382.1 outer membrane usher protein [Chromobacterium alkanivorans]MCS3820606.1 outer membrane usher protein [Chromobacterium alkanivorans]MCS3875364.1 outer membrane usher protein [Chromobacterium alkanivorans]